ncbi:type II secretion system pilot lipoprotein GspS-beta [Aliivibrio fischeri]|uniref:type II secretion system pilot lipoprotein GspS-beta n=2 Tax=Aliivibrio fischeri TaxID=668 RepID=UPI0009BE899E|nr:type II secretion system pilot lipoprotein GspS-beta [Aliivibrio fischeri]
MFICRVFLFLFLLCSLLSCSSKINNKLAFLLTNYRSDIISKYLPYKVGSVTLLSVTAVNDRVNIYVMINKNINIKRLLYNVTVRFCENVEIKGLLNRGVSYRVVILNTKKIKELEHVITLSLCGKNSDFNE